MIEPWGKAVWQKREKNDKIAHFLIETLIHLINFQNASPRPGRRYHLAKCTQIAIRNVALTPYENKAWWVSGGCGLFQVAAGLKARPVIARAEAPEKPSKEILSRPVRPEQSDQTASLKDQGLGRLSSEDSVMSFERSGRLVSGD